MWTKNVVLHFWFPLNLKCITLGKLQVLLENLLKCIVINQSWEHLEKVLPNQFAIKKVVLLLWNQRKLIEHFLVNPEAILRKKFFLQNDKKRKKKTIQFELRNG